MTFKKCHKWTTQEEEVLKKYFYDMPHSSHHGSRFDYLLTKLKENGCKVSDLTPKAISRKTYRLGLKSTSIENEQIIDCVCTECHKGILRPKRYISRAKCNECLEKSRHTPTDIDRHREYHRKYKKQYRKKQNSPLI